MKHYLLCCSVVSAAVVFAVSFAVLPHLAAQAPPSKPTPHLADGRPDLNGTWDRGGLEFVRPQTLPDGSICVIGCPPAAGTAPRGNAGPPAGGQAATPAAP